MKLRSLLVLALAGAFGFPVSGNAAEPLRLAEALERALASHPLLAAEMAELHAAQARAGREALATPYIVGGEVENFVGTGALSGFKSAENTLRIGRVLELGGKRTARQALGTAQVDQQRNQAEATRIAVASRTAGRFIEVVADQHRLAYAQERVKQAERIRREVASWVPPHEILARRIRLAGLKPSLTFDQLMKHSSRAYPRGFVLCRSSTQPHNQNNPCLDLGVSRT